MQLLFLPKRVLKSWSASTSSDHVHPHETDSLILSPSPVIPHSLDEKKAQVVVEEITSFGGDAIAVGGDVGAEDFPKRILEATIGKYGKLNHIINNGVFLLEGGVTSLDV